MKRLLSFSFSKIYIIVMILISLLVVGEYFSYAMFTVSKERSNAISIVTGNLIYDLTVEGEDKESLVIPANTTMEFTVTLSNPNNRIARFNFYYLGNLPDGVSAGYIVEENFNIPPAEAGLNLEKNGTSGSSNTYKIKVTNASDSSVTINLGVSVGLDYNDLSLPSNGHLFEEYSVPLADVLLIDKTNNINKSDSEQYFITEKTPNNYIWYSGKLWRAVSIDPSDNSVKMVTQWNISGISQNSNNNSAFASSHIKMWLNDTTTDGFLGNLRDYENFIKLDSKWNATITTATTKPAKTTMVESPVGLLNIYEYTMSYSGTTYANGYLNNGLQWITLTPTESARTRSVLYNGTVGNDLSTYAGGARPTVNLKPNIKVAEGIGSEDDPYRLEGDDDKDLNGVKLNTRYSGEYIKFGTGENNLYRIVSREGADRIKITTATPLKENNNWMIARYGPNNTYNSSNPIRVFLNGEYLTSGKYLTSEQVSMIEESGTWYNDLIELGENYKLVKYTDTNGSSFNPISADAKIGLLRYGELMSGQFNRYGLREGGNTDENNTTYWLLNPYSSTLHRYSSVNGDCAANNPTAVSFGIKPTFYLKPTVVITGGDGTKENPFEIENDPK